MAAALSLPLGGSRLARPLLYSASNLEISGCTWVVGDTRRFGPGDDGGWGRVCAWLGGKDELNCPFHCFSTAWAAHRFGEALLPCPGLPQAHSPSALPTPNSACGSVLTQGPIASSDPPSAAKTLPLLRADSSPPHQYISTRHRGQQPPAETSMFISHEPEEGWSQASPWKAGCCGGRREEQGSSAGSALFGKPRAQLPPFAGTFLIQSGK